MENSVSSSPNKVIISPSKLCTSECNSLSEESGWTQYIDDFHKDDKQHGAYDEEDNTSSYMLMSGSMVSDAGSGPEWRRKNTMAQTQAQAQAHAGYSLPNMPIKRLNFKNKRTQDIPFDYSLEDTASSPVNSPKITTYFNRMDLNTRKFEKDNGSPMAKELSIHEVEYNDIYGEHLTKVGYEVECMELKQKGLCLVPVSMVPNYIGQWTENILDHHSLSLPEDTNLTNNSYVP